jgi:hypothetical protein
MATFLRELYEVLSIFSTATHTAMCKDILRKLKATTDDNLARYFADALKANKLFCQIERPFIPDDRDNITGTNPVTTVMMRTSPLKFSVTEGITYEFSYLQREIPHLRAMTKDEQDSKGWIDYAARTKLRPILGEIKWKGDKNSFYAFIQLLTYLSEMATPNQIARSVRHELFGNDLPANPAFDLHIFLGNFNDRGEKGPLIELTRELASVFKRRLLRDFPETAKCLGNVLCISGEIEDGSDVFSEVRCRWMV